MNSSVELEQSSGSAGCLQAATNTDSIPNDVMNRRNSAKILLELIKSLLEQQQYEGVEKLLFAKTKEALKNQECLSSISMDLYQDVCLKNLTDENYAKNSKLFNCAEDILKLLANHAPLEELLMELLELIEENKSEHVFTTALKALQVVLLRQGDDKPRALEWSLNSICTRMEDISLPDFLKQGYDDKQQRLLEQNEQIQSLLMQYLTLGYFYEPLLQEICATSPQQDEPFRFCGLSRRNVLCCFLIQLLGKPLSLLDLSNQDEERKSNTYSLQCARSLTQSATKCIGDPLYFLWLIEARLRWKRHLDESKNVHEMSCSNIFLINEKLPLDSLAIYYYMIFVESIDADKIPLVYSKLFIFESILYLIQELLCHEEPALHEKALRLMEKVLQQPGLQEIPFSSLDLQIHQNFCTTLCSLIAYSAHTHLRQQGIRLLKEYILKFTNEGKYLIINYLMQCVSHNGINGYLVSIYKDLVAAALKTSDSTELPLSYCANDFQSIFLQNICKLPQAVETDLIENSDKIISSLNALRYFAINDMKNRTGFWNFIETIEELYLNNLRKALDLSQAHYKAELQKVEKGLDKEDNKHFQQLQMLNIAIGNDKSASGGQLNFELDRDNKLKILNQNLCTFDLIRSLLARVTECLDNKKLVCRTGQS